MTRKIPRLLLPALFAVACVAHAQGRGGRGPQVVIAPDHADWKYVPGENVNFSIHVTENNAPASGVKVNWSVGPEWSESGQPLSSGTLTTGAEDAHVNAGTLKEPGFLRLTATIVPDAGAQAATPPGGRGGFSPHFVGTAGFSPEKIKPVAVEPADFDAFWQKGKDALAAIPINALRTPYAPKTTDTRSEERRVGK